MDYFQLKQYNVHLHGLDMRDTYTNSIIKTFLNFQFNYKVQNLYKKHFLKHKFILCLMPLKQQKIHLHGVDMRGCRQVYKQLYNTMMMQNQTFL